MTSDLLVELGVEELPAPFLTRAMELLPSAVDQMLTRERLGHGAVRVIGTPRRLAVMVAEVEPSQPDETRAVTGPPEKVAVDASTGGFTTAALKFAQKFGADASDLTLVDGPKGRVVGLTVHEKGRSASEIVAAILPEIFSERTLPYPHSMYWGSHTGPFVRPVHWLVVMLGSQVVPAEIFGIASGNLTAGHRFHDPGPHALAEARAYEATLEKARVIADPQRRREKLVAGLARLAEEAGAALVPDEDLVHEVVQLTGQPVPVRGGFMERFLEIPEQVVITAMAVHQRYFALRSKQDGRLLPAFIAVANTEPTDEQAVRRGFERVLTARLEDARFCHDEDLSHRLSDHVEGLAGMVFQAGMGTYLDKTRRLEKLCPALGALVPGRSTPADVLARAAGLCKADLLTRVVFEFPELQGVMGAQYARAEGMGDVVAEAIRDHYRPAGPADDLPGTEAGLLLALSDKVDTLVGFFALGKKPKGGSDPFGLRRACLGMVRILLALGERTSVSAMIDIVYPMLSGFDLKVKHEVVRAEILEFLEGRLRVLWQSDARADVLDACLACGVDDVVLARRRLEALSAFMQTEEFEDLSVAFKRAYRITRDAPGFPDAPDEKLYEQDEERALHAAVLQMDARVGGALGAGDFSSAFEEFRKLRAPVDAFFEKVFVNVDQPRIRDNRLALLGWMVRLIEPAARLDLLHFDRTKIESS